MSIRFASTADSPALLGIYAQYIDTPVTFEYELPSQAAFAQRIASVLQTYPFLLCEENGRIVGYAYAHRQKEREAYQWNAELSIYLDSSSTARGLGKRLYGALMEILSLQGVRTVYGVVTLPNAKSERLHASCGFRYAGTHQRTGFKCGRWHDVAWFEKAIAPYDAPAAPILPVGALPQEAIAAILKKYS